MAVVAGATATFIKGYSYGLALAILPLVLIAFTLFTAYLAQVEVVSTEAQRRRATEKKFTVLLSTLTYKRRLLEVFLDMLVISSAFYLAFALRFEFHLNEVLFNLFADSLPIVIVATYTGFFLFGLYRGLWRYTGVEDLLRIAKAVVCSTFLSMAGMVFVYRFDGYSRIVMIVYGCLLFVGVAATRLSFRVFASLIHGPRKEKVPVLIYGAGDGGEVVLRECRKNAGGIPAGRFPGRRSVEARPLRRGATNFRRCGQTGRNHTTRKSGRLHHLFAGYLGEWSC
jgi:UDP-GlcNAc:undecaprenyl-phosphate GlcNAc-1-phosphate transferase